MKYHNVKNRTIFLVVLICMVIFLSISLCEFRGMSETKASETFRQYVLNPIPGSVRNIRVDKPKYINGYRYTFRFNINRKDLSLLINSKPFVRVWNIKYRDGSLDWYWDRDGPLLGIGTHGSSMLCYNRSDRKPDWFKPGLWDNPETYAFWKEGDLVNIETFDKKSSGPVEIRLLLYNENDAEAYFVVTYWEN